MLTRGTATKPTAPSSPTPRRPWRLLGVTIYYGLLFDRGSQVVGAICRKSVYLLRFMISICSAMS